MDQARLERGGLAQPDHLERELPLEAGVPVGHHDRQDHEGIGQQVHDGEVLLRQVVVLPHVAAGDRMVGAGDDRGQQAGVGALGRHQRARPARLDDARGARREIELRARGDARQEIAGILELGAGEALGVEGDDEVLRGAGAGLVANAGVEPVVLAVLGRLVRRCRRRRRCESTGRASPRTRRPTASAPGSAGSSRSHRSGAGDGLARP